MTDIAGAGMSDNSGMSDMRDRIAAAIYVAADPWEHGFPWESLADHVKVLYREQADAVIAELGLSVTGGVIVGCLHDPPDYCNRCGIPHHSKCKRPADV